MSQGSPEVKRRYQQSEKGRAQRAANLATPEARAKARARALRYYYYTPKGKASQQRYLQSDKGKANLARGVHKRRANMAIESTLTAAEWAEIKAGQHQRCLYCGAKVPLTMDHRVPLSKGGPHNVANVVAACRSCNSAKGNR